MVTTETAPSSTAHRADWKSFFWRVFGRASGYLCIGHKRDGRYHEAFFAYPDDLDGALNDIAEHYETADVYFCPHLFGEKRRSKETVTVCPAAWADLDECKPEKLLVTPSIVMETSEGHWQALWLFEEPQEPRQAERLSRRIAYFHKADGCDSGWALTKLLRVPLTHNHKPERRTDDGTAPQVSIVATGPATYRSPDFSEYPELPDDNEHQDATELPELPTETATELLAQLNDERATELFTSQEAADNHKEGHSGALWELESRCREGGLTQAQTFIVARDAVCNKYRRDGRSQLWLWKEVRKNFANSDTPITVTEPVATAEPDPTPVTTSLPTLGDDALSGLAGSIVRALEPETSAHPAALLTTFLSMVGNAVGIDAHAMYNATPHKARVNVLIVGTTSSGAKGESLDDILPIMGIAEPDWMNSHCKEGLSTGEGLIAELNRISADDNTDRRLMLTETEFGRVLTVAARHDATLSHIIRQMWDRDSLRVLRGNPLHADDVHGSILGHITPEELEAKLTTTDIANGFANRFLFVHSARTRLLPHGGDVLAVAQRFGPEVQTAIYNAQNIGHTVGVIRRTEAANRLWEDWYYDWHSDKSCKSRAGYVALLTRRAEANILRLSLIYALLDGSSVIERQHLVAALAVWNYSVGSVRHLFGDSIGNNVADRIREQLSSVYPKQEERNKFYKWFGGHVTSKELTTAIKLLLEMDAIEQSIQKTAGRSKELYRLKLS
jgi:hypothetical protein